MPSVLVSEIQDSEVANQQQQVSGNKIGQHMSDSI